MKITNIHLKYLFDTNCYLLQNDTGYYLIDAGIKKQRKKLEEALIEAGCRTGDLKLIIITHGHLDHIGNAAYIRDRYNTKIAMHQGDVNMVTGGGMFADAPQGKVIKIVTWILNITGLGDFETFTPDLTIEDNQSLNEYGLNVKIVHTPGHSKGSISILTDDGELFCGDIFNGSEENPTTLIDDQAQLDQTLEHIKTLSVETFYPGHGRPFTR